MRSLAVAELAEGRVILFPLFHESGELLVAPGPRLQRRQIVALAESGIQVVWECEGEDDVWALRKVSGRGAVRFEDLRPGQTLDHPIYDEDGRVLIQKGHQLTGGALQTLERRSSRGLFRDPLGAPAPARTEVDRYRVALLSGLAIDLDERVDLQRELVIAPDGPPFTNVVANQRPSYDGATIGALLGARREATEGAREVLSRLQQGKVVPGDLSRRTLDFVCEYLVRAPNLLLGTANLVGREDFLSDHAVSVASVGMAIGSVLGYGEKQIREVGLACFLANVGMARIDPEVIRKPGPFRPEEMVEVKKHPAYGLHLLQQCHAVPDVVTLAIYQSHERDDGSGYPKRRHGTHIHDYARILGIADMYVAMGSPRWHRTAMLPYEAMETLVHMASRKVVRAPLVRALLKAVALYPIGSWLQLSTGETARVVASGGDAFDRPVVSILLDSKGRPLGAPRVVDLKKTPGVRVVRALAPLSGEGQAPLLGFGPSRDEG